MASYIDHVCLFVKNYDWTLDFFQTVYDMPVETVKVQEGVRKVWLVGGIQIIENTGDVDVVANPHHICLLVDDLEGSRAKALEWGCRELPQHHWVEMPNGLQIEMFAAAEGAVEALAKLPKKAK